MSGPRNTRRPHESDRATVTVATEQTVFGYHPPSSRSRMMSASDHDDDDDVLNDDDVTETMTLGELRSVLRKLIDRYIIGA